MRRFQLATAIVSLALIAPAYAHEPSHGPSLEEQIQQVFSGLQVIDQSVTVPGSGQAAPDTTTTAGRGSDPTEASPEITQAATNGSDLLSVVGAPVGQVQQVLDGQQVIRQTMAFGAVDLNAVAQVGFNFSGVVTAPSVNALAQYMDSDALQSIVNRVDVAGRVGTIAQEGTNAANLAFVDGAIGSGEQYITAGAKQEINNYVALGSAAQPGHVDTVEQTGINLGNILIADRVENITRVFSGDQAIHNEVDARGSALPATIHQSGTNIANYVKAEEIGTLNQISVGSQTTINTVTDDTLQHYTTHPDGGTLTQVSDANFVNVVVLGASSPKANSNSTITQTAQVDQGNHGGGPAMQVGNAVIIDR